MPRIREYRPQVTAQGPIETRRATAEDAGGLMGQIMAESGRDLQRLGLAVQEQDEQREVSDIRAKMAKARADWTLNLVERSRSAEPGDTQFTQQFNSDLQGYLGAIGEGIQTRQGRLVFEQLSATLSGDLNERAFTHQAALMGKKAKLDAEVRINQGRNTLLNDPTQFDRVLEDTITDLNGMANLDPAQRESLTVFARQGMAVSAVQGFIQVAPQGAKDSLQQGSWDEYLDADNKAVLIGQADTALRALEVERQRQAAEAKAALKEEQKATGNQFVELVQTGKLTTSQVLASNLDPTGENSKEHWINVIRTRAKEATEQKAVKTSPGEFSAVLQAIRSGTITSETEIEKYYTHRRTISWDDIKELRKELNEFRTPEGERITKVKDSFLRAMKPQIDKSNPLMGKIDQTGAEQFYNFEHYVNQRIMEARKQGVDPYELFDPNSGKYLGRSVRSFQKSLSESARQIRNLSAPPAPTAPTGGQQARKPGETAQQYLERIGK